MDQLDKPLEKQPEQFDRKLAEQQSVHDAGRRIGQAGDVGTKPSEIDARNLAPKDGQLDGKTGEKIAAQALEAEGRRPGGRIETRDGFTNGQFDGIHGIDLVGADKQGKPIVVEVKETHSGEAKLNDKPLQSMEGTKYERPVMQDGKWVKPEGEGRLSDVQQMDDNWTKDRWIRLINDPIKRHELSTAGVDSKYLNPHNFSENTRLWNDIFENRKVAVVSPAGADAVGTQLQEQVRQPNRYCEIIPIRV